VGKVFTPWGEGIQDRARQVASEFAHLLNPIAMGRFHYSDTNRLFAIQTDLAAIRLGIGVQGGRELRVEDTMGQ
jgi:hypothetical protein